MGDTSIVVIGLGGFGLRTLRCIQRVAKNGRNHAIPTSRVHLLGIDMGLTQEGGAGEGPPLPDADYLSLWTPGEAAEHYTHLLHSLVPIHVLAGWRYQDHNPALSYDRSCRALSRTVYLCQTSRVEKKINTLLRRASREGQPPLVYVVTSLTGSTGSALYLDVCDAIRRMFDEPLSLTGLVYAPSVVGTRFAETWGIGSATSAMLAWAEFQSAAIERQHRGPVETIVVSSESSPFRYPSVELEQVADAILSGVLPQTPPDNGSITLGIQSESESSTRLFWLSAMDRNPSHIGEILKPIAEIWDRERGNRVRFHQIENFRRTRVLGEGLPTGTAVIRAMIRGWFTGRILGLIRVDSVESDDVVRILAPSGEIPTVLNFPSPLSHSARTHHPGDVLCAVLESLLTAYLDFSRTGESSAFRAHELLRELGSTENVSGSPSEHHLLSLPMLTWLRDGEVRWNQKAEGSSSTVGYSDTVVLHPALTTEFEDDAESRRRALLEVLDEIVERYAQHHKIYWENAVGRGSLLNGDLRWTALIDEKSGTNLVLDSLMDLRQAVAMAQFDS